MRSMIPRGDQKVQRPLRATVGNAHSQGLLAPAQSAEIQHRPVEADEPQQALNEPGCLTERHAEEDLHRQACLDRGIAILRLPTSLAGRRRHPDHVRIEPDRKGAALLERFVVGRPVLGLVARRDGSAHASQLPRWIHEMNPSSYLCATKPVRSSSSRMPDRSVGSRAGCRFGRVPRGSHPSIGTRSCGSG